MKTFSSSKMYAEFAIILLKVLKFRIRKNFPFCCDFYFVASAVDVESLQWPDENPLHGDYM